MVQRPQPETVILNEDLELLQALAIGYALSKTEAVVSQPLPDQSSILHVQTRSDVSVIYSPKEPNFYLHVTGPETQNTDSPTTAQKLVTWREKTPKSGVIRTHLKAETGKKITIQPILPEDRREIVNSLIDLLLADLKL